MSNNNINKKLKKIEERSNKRLAALDRKSMAVTEKAVKRDATQILKIEKAKQTKKLKEAKPVVDKTIKLEDKKIKKLNVQLEKENPTPKKSKKKNKPVVEITENNELSKKELLEAKGLFKESKKTIVADAKTIEKEVINYEMDAPKVVYLNRRMSLNDKDDHNFYWFLIDQTKKSDMRYVTKVSALKYIKTHYLKVKVNIQDNVGNFAYKITINNGELTSVKGSEKQFFKDENLNAELLEVFGQTKKNVKKTKKVEQADVVGTDFNKAILKDVKLNEKIDKKNDAKIVAHETKVALKVKKGKKVNTEKKVKLAKKDRKAEKILNKHKITESIIRGSIEKSAPLLKIENVTKHFGSFKALDGVSFEIARGERIGLIGGNGAGKTTLTEIIAGINKPSDGTITYGFNFEDTPKENIGMQFQQSTYPSGLTVKDIIRFAINLRKLTMSPAELYKMLQVFQMEDFYSRKVRSLSGGQRQKLNILLSILHNPRLVILDELSTGLDISAREEIISFADKLLKDMGMSAIVISHHMGEISALCTRVVVLDRGKVVGIKLISEIIKSHGSLETYAKQIIRKSNEEARKLSAAKAGDTSEIGLMKITQKRTKFSKKVDKQLKKEGKAAAKSNGEEVIVKVVKTKVEIKEEKIEKKNTKKIDQEKRAELRKIYLEEKQKDIQDKKDNKMKGGK